MFNVCQMGLSEWKVLIVLVPKGGGAWHILSDATVQYIDFSGDMPHWIQWSLCLSIHIKDCALINIDSHYIPVLWAQGRQIPLDILLLCLSLFSYVLYPSRNEVCMPAERFNNVFILPLFWWVGQHWVHIAEEWNKEIIKITVCVGGGGILWATFYCFGTHYSCKL